MTDATTAPAPEKPERYHPFLVALHWIIAIMIVGMLALGFFILENMENGGEKAELLQLHFSIGVVIFTLMAVRFGVRLFTAKPPKASTGNRFLDSLAVFTHYAFYVLVLGMAVSGLGVATLSGLFDVFANNAPLPESFDVFPPMKGHEITSYLLAGLVSLHVLAALYHHYVLKDNLLARMWFAPDPEEDDADTTTATA